MKKLIAALLTLVLLISCFGCGDTTATEETTDATDETVGEATENIPDNVEPAVDKYADVDESVPNAKGVYQIHTAQGLLNMAEHPDGKFELLCDIDLGGISWTPVGTKSAPFKGELDGSYFTISNFTIDAPTADGDQGFFGVMTGEVKDTIFRDFSVNATADTQRMGALCGVCEGTVLRCEFYGDVNAEACAKNAAIGGVTGTLASKLRNSTVAVNMTVETAEKATVGGLAGTAMNEKLSDNTQEGVLTLSGKNLTAGLFIGEGEKTELKNNIFLGAGNHLNGEIFIDFFGAETDCTTSGCGYRDNTPIVESAQLRAMRDTVSDYMRQMGTVEWQVRETVYHSCTCSLTVCHGAFYPGTIYVGIPYNHKGCTYEKFLYAIDDEGYLYEWVGELGSFDGYDMYIGNDCSSAVRSAWSLVSNSFTWTGTSSMLPSKGLGTIAVGDWPWEVELNSRGWTEKYLTSCDEQTMYKSYAQMRKGDAYVNMVEAGGHTRMCADDPVVVYDQDGNVDPIHSYVLSHEQGAPTSYEPYYSTWRTDYKYTFAELYTGDYVPVTIEEFLTGEMEEHEISLLDGKDGKAGLTTGVVKSNYYLNSVQMVITDSDGNEVFNHTMWSNTGKRADHNSNDLTSRAVIYEYDLAHFATPLRDVVFDVNESYHCVISAAMVGCDAVTVAELDF